jgi:hypothetical protein
MISVACVLVVLVLAAYFFSQRRQFRKRIERREKSYSVRTVGPGGDPFKDRIEFHLRKRSGSMMHPLGDDPDTTK